MDFQFFTIFLEYKFKDLGLGKIKRGEWFLQGHPKGRILDLTKPWTSIIIVGLVTTKNDTYTDDSSPVKGLR